MAGLADFWVHCHERGRRAPLRAMLLVTLGFSLLFVLFPSLDLAVSSLFFQVGHSFPLRELETLRQFRAIGSDLPVIIAVVLAIVLLLKLVYPRRETLLSPRLALFYVLLFITGPLLIVNGLFKPFWGRPRPVDTVLFGGEHPFLSAWAVADCCIGNRSFVSGEAASAACLLCFVFFVAPAWRRAVAALIGSFAVAVSANRIAFGAHYLSDVAIAWGLMLSLALWMRHLFFVAWARHLSDPALEAHLTWAGLVMHRLLRSDLPRNAGRIARELLHRAGTWPARPAASGPAPRNRAALSPADSAGRAAA